MKIRFILFLLMTLNQTISGQITLAHTFQSTSMSDVGVLHFYYAGNKFIERNDSLSTITLYNSDFSVYKSITFPPLPYDNPYQRRVAYLTETLFDTDSTDLEYLLYYTDSTGSKVSVYDENGALLFHRDSASFSASFGYAIGILTNPSIDYIDSVFFLRVHTVSGTEIYQLPGTIPCFDPCSKSDLGQHTGIYYHESSKEYLLSDPIPNPTTADCKIAYNLPPGVTHAVIQFYDAAGRSVKSVHVNSRDHMVNIPLTSFQAGTLYYNMQWDEGSSGGFKKLVIVR